MTGSKATVQRLVAGAVAALLVAGCGSARVAHRDDRGGTIVLNGDRTKAVDDAHELMVGHCRGPYQIIGEGKPGPGQQGEWRITYVCGRRDAPERRQDGSARALGAAEPAAASGQGGGATPRDAAPLDAAPHLPTVLDLISPISADAGP